MKKAKYFFLAFLFSFFVFNFSLDCVRAASLWDQQDMLGGSVATTFGESKASPTDIRYRIVKIINSTLGILGLVVVVLIIFAGFKWMTAAGNEESISSAKAILKNAIIGLIIITFAWSVTLFIIKRLDKNYKEDWGVTL
ncbi:hypothetical protein CVU82_00205 [Candidatus Falkowbacteria bacterium HGW-Falkowbacteria-1]|jgi:hypothetical protein|uniref:DUF5671 domain-containing protein n=1 Tax=Candidatus Falkowbacteria bacterium HGW-Falkowbacteria-1 TaxID=2013768 RepID=A0A2N2EA57_9BACT|nr:MAG: hypothetical protein CVU82_00205 [Candidatus Falkowbacteria bacterium HGW-Falkowbacteria-1]